MTKSFNDLYIHESSYVDNDVSKGQGTKVWHFSPIFENSVVRGNFSLGQNVVVGPDVTIGNRVKTQNNVSIYEDVTLKDKVSYSPAFVFTNVNNPRSDLVRKREYRKTVVGKWKSIGANAATICGHNLGKYCFITARSVVTKEVPPYALIMGNPAKQAGWISKAGGGLGSQLICPIDGSVYKEISPNRIEEV